jgi:C1A family cysteine protease
MSSLLKLFGFFAIVCGFVSAQIFHPESNLIERFKNWVITHKIQANDEHHLAHMFENWLDNDKFIELTNFQNLSYTLGHNAYSGMNSDEFNQFMGFGANKDFLAKRNFNSDTDGEGFLRGSVSVISQTEILDLSVLPTSIDWRTSGVVSEVRDQGQCGSCYSFSSTSTLESAVAIKYGKLYDLSEQQIVSCSLKYGNLKCNGGYYSSAWDFNKENGQCSEADYPYTSGKGDGGNCISECKPVSGTQVKSYVDVVPSSDSALMTALTVEPVSIAIEADTRSYQMYKSGVYTDFKGCGDTLDHAVVLVGYGSDTNQDYYILRNSWGTSWGENGYMRIGRGSQYGDSGMCGLLLDPMYPVV